MMKRLPQTSDQRKERMRRIVADFQKYVATYSNQAQWESYSDNTFLSDMLYGIGIAMDRNQYEYGSGYKKWRDRLRKFLGCYQTEFEAWVNAKGDADDDEN